MIQLHYATLGARGQAQFERKVTLLPQLRYPPPQEARKLLTSKLTHANNCHTGGSSRQV